MTDVDLRSNFAAYVMFVNNYISLNKNRFGSNRRISELNSGGLGGRGRRNGSGRGGAGGRGQDQDQDRERGGPSQNEVDKCSHITEAFYANKKYTDFNAAERHKVW